MPETTDIEKKSLEAHVELCAERYRFLENKMEVLEEKITSVNVVIREVHDMIETMSNKRTDQIMSWGLAIMASLVGIIAYLLSVYVIK